MDRHARRGALWAGRYSAAAQGGRHRPLRRLRRVEGPRARRGEGPAPRAAARAQDKAPIEAPLLLSVFVPEATSNNALEAARQGLDARLNSGEGDHARWQGYLALVAHALGEKDAFPPASSLPRACRGATYLDQPRRPESLDALLSEVAARK